MIPAPLHHDDEHRVAALRRCENPDAVLEPATDRIVSLPAQFLVVPTALVDSVDADPLSVTSKVGFEELQASRDLARRGCTPAEFANRSFKRFAMVDGENRRPASSGLGLRIARAVIERQGDWIGFAGPLYDGGTWSWLALLRSALQR